VETAAEHAVLQSLGVDGGQGWLFGRPAPVDALVEAGTVPTPEPLTA
jgi:EAL domain-containing protein (putative c-di-GMP-specific phosphodiesterase class I)